MALSPRNEQTNDKLKNPLKPYPQQAAGKALAYRPTHLLNIQVVTVFNGGVIFDDMR